MLKLTEQTFDQEIATTPGLLVVDFFSESCGPCKRLAPLLDQLAAAHPDVKFAKVDVTEQMPLALKHDISALPTLLFIKGGQIVQKSLGLQSMDKLESLIAEAVQ